jgi:hypothetical protein
MAISKIHVEYKSKYKYTILLIKEILNGNGNGNWNS